MKIFNASEINGFQDLIINAEKAQKTKQINLEKWFSLDAFGKYDLDFLVSGRNCGQPIFVNDEFNYAFKMQTIYSPIVNEEKSKFILHSVKKVSIKIKAIEFHGKWIDQISSGHTFQTVIARQSLENLDLPFNAPGKKWRLGNNWVDLEYPTYFIAVVSEQINNFDVIQL